MHETVHIKLKEAISKKQVERIGWGIFSKHFYSFYNEMLHLFILKDFIYL